ncbi:MAG: 2-iminoacetate synthase ThiH [Clostridia bacterium]|nr:2-iminoacetate synthase ThiH [Clostridia bacterium]
MFENSNHMEFFEGMEDIKSDLREKVLSKRDEIDFDTFTKADVKTAIYKENLNEMDFAALLSPAASEMLDEIAHRAFEVRKKHFGNCVNLFTPIYIANYCENACVYCGFRRDNKIHRAKLDDSEIKREMQAIKEDGLEEVLILTGESDKYSDVKYIANACKMASEHFKNVAVEIYPCDVEDYKYLHEHHADYVTVFQETYDIEKYGQLHPAGKKRSFPYRFDTQERAILGGIRGVGFGVLFGLTDFRKDAFSNAYHAYLLQRKYPHAEIAMSCPRLRPTPGDSYDNYNKVTERELLQIICAYRLFLPFAAITVSTRERAGFRKEIVKYATKISAGVSTGIGLRGKDIEDKGDDQFEIADSRSVKEIVESIKESGFQPVMNDYLFV